VPEVRRLLSAGADIEYCSGAPLHEASYHGSVQVIKELLEHEVDTEAKDIDGGTPLHWVFCFWMEHHRMAGIPRHK
jgi:ankyrin repeat protein